MIKTFNAQRRRSRISRHSSDQPGQTMRTGQPVLETYPTEQAWLEALAVLGVDPNDITNSYQR